MRQLTQNISRKIIICKHIHQNILNDNLTIIWLRHYYGYLLWFFWVKDLPVITKKVVGVLVWTESDLTSVSFDIQIILWDPIIVSTQSIHLPAESPGGTDMDGPGSICPDGHSIVHQDVHPAPPGGDTQIYRVVG